MHLRRGGAGPRGAMHTLSQYMLSSAATFSFFLAIGSVRGVELEHKPLLTVSRVQVIRSDSRLVSPHMEALILQSRFAPQTLHSKISGSRIIRERWEAEKQKQNA